MRKFSLHDLVVVTDPIEIEPCNATIEKGERGKIIDVDPETADLCIRLSNHHPDLRCRRNIVTLTAAEAGSKIRLVPTLHPYTFRQAALMTIAGIAVAVALVVGITPQLISIEVRPVLHDALQQATATNGIPHSITGPLPLAQCPPHQFSSAGI